MMKKTWIFINLTHHLLSHVDIHPRKDIINFFAILRSNT